MKKALLTFSFVVFAMITAAIPAKALVYTFEVTVAELKAHLNSELPMSEWAIYEVWFKANADQSFNNLKTPLKGQDGWDTNVAFKDWCGACSKSGDFAMFFDLPQNIGGRAYITDMPFVQGVTTPGSGDVGVLMPDDSIFSFQVKTDEQLVGPVLFDLVTVADPKCKFQTSPNTCEELFGPFGGKTRTDFNSPIALLPRHQVSEPITLALFAFGLIGLCCIRPRQLA